MDKVYIVYWSMTGNTEAMAQAVADGVTDAGKEAVLRRVDEISAAELSEQPAFALGCPAMGDEVLEEGDFEPFISDLESSLKGKKVGLFGSYGWGDGQWMREWCKRCENAILFDEAGLMLCETPDEEGQEACRKLGESLAKW